VRELQALNSTLVRGRDALETELRRLAHENEVLREAKLRTLQSGDGGGDDGEEQHGALAALVAELKERLAYVEEERLLLLRQKESLADELDQVLADRSEQDSQLAALNTQVRELHYSRAYLDELAAEAAAAEARVVQLARELGDEQQRGAQQAATTRSLREESEQWRGAAGREEAARKAAEKQGEESDAVLQAKIQSFAGRIRDLQAKLAGKTNECEAR
jgi:peptidoglycan hydrolase CwlO-like protein